MQIITGTAASGIAIGLANFASENNILYISGSANSDALTGINKNTFRGTRQSYQDIAAIGAILGDKLDGANVVLLAHDIEYGKSLIKEFRDVLGNRAGSITEILAPFPTSDVAPYVQRVKDAHPDIVLPFLSGDSTPWYQSFQQQALLDNTLMVTNTGTRGTWPLYQQIWNDHVRVFTPYAVGAENNEAAKYLTKNVPDADFHSGDGFTAALMLVGAIKSAGPNGDVASWIDALNGYKFDGPRGETTVRKGDHALLAPYYMVSFESGKPEIVETIGADKLVPPVK